MQLWLNRTGEVSLREQLVTQMVLGILGRELAPGERLPSTRELARRYGIHANTASRAYRQMERDGWLEFRRGSGVFVREARTGGGPSNDLPPERATELSVDHLIAELVSSARQAGASASLLRERLRRYLALEPPSRWLVIEPDPELRQILVFEMQEALRLPVAGCAPDECPVPEAMARSLPAARPSKVESVRKLLPAETDLTILEIRSITHSMRKYLPNVGDELIAIASRWKQFVRTANTILVAAGIEPERLLLRDATRAGWKRGLEQTFGILCDAALKQHLPLGPHRIAFRLLDDAALLQLRQIEDAANPAALG